MLFTALSSSDRYHRSISKSAQGSGESMMVTGMTRWALGAIAGLGTLAVTVGTLPVSIAAASPLEQNGFDCRGNTIYCQAAAPSGQQTQPTRPTRPAPSNQTAQNYTTHTS